MPHFQITNSAALSKGSGFWFRLQGSSLAFYWGGGLPGQNEEPDEGISTSLYCLGLLGFAALHLVSQPRPETLNPEAV